MNSLFAVGVDGDINVVIIFIEQRTAITNCRTLLLYQVFRHK